MRTFTQRRNQAQQNPLFSGLAGAYTATPVPLHRADSLRAIGSQAVQRVSQTHAEELDAGLNGTASSPVGHDFRRIPIYPSTRGAMQTKLAVGTPGDKYEQEADRVAEQVTRMADGAFESNVPISSKAQGGEAQRKCNKCEETEDEEVLQKSSASGAQNVADSSSPVPPIVGEVLSSPGQPLDMAARAFMEPRFGADFGNVRVHSDFAAARSAQAVNAHAYTVGEQIVFNRGRYAPGTEEGRRLLAHELTHVVQQSGTEPVIRRQEAAPTPAPEPEPAPAPPAVPTPPRLQPKTTEYLYVPFNDDGTWDATAILALISQNELTETRTFMPLPGAGRESDKVRCAANATLATSIAAGPKAVVNLTVNLYKRIMGYRDRSKAKAQTDMPSAEVCEKALNQIAGISRNLEFCMKRGSKEGSACTMTIADFDRLANWLYLFSFNPEDEGRRLTKEGVGDLVGYKARFRTDNEIAEAAKELAGYDKGLGRQPVKDEAELNGHLNELSAGESLLGLWGVHTYTFFRDKGDGQIYIYDSWTPGDTIHVEGSDGYKKRVTDGLSDKESPMKIIKGRRYDRSMFNEEIGPKHLQLSHP